MRRRRYLFEIVTPWDAHPYSRHRLRRRCAADREIGGRLLVRQNGDGPIRFDRWDALFDETSIIAYPYTERRPRGR